METTIVNIRKLKTCIEELDHTQQHEQALLLDTLDAIVNDIQRLNRDYHAALRTQRFREHVERMRDTHQRWITLLQRLIRARIHPSATDRIIETMHNAVQQLIERPIPCPIHQAPSNKPLRRLPRLNLLKLDMPTHPSYGPHETISEKQAPLPHQRAS